MRILRWEGGKLKNDIVGHRHVSEPIGVTLIKDKVTDGRCDGIADSLWTYLRLTKQNLKEIIFKRLQQDWRQPFKETNSKWGYIKPLLDVYDLTKVTTCHHMI